MNSTLGKTQRKQLTLRLPAELDIKLTKGAREMGVSKNAFAVMLINQNIQNSIKEKK